MAKLRPYQQCDLTIYIFFVFINKQYSPLIYRRIKNCSYEITRIFPVTKLSHAEITKTRTMPFIIWTYSHSCFIQRRLCHEFFRILNSFIIYQTVSGLRVYCVPLIRRQNHRSGEGDFSQQCLFPTIVAFPKAVVPQSVVEMRNIIALECLARTLTE